MDFQNYVYDISFHIKRHDHITTLGISDYIILNISNDLHQID